MSDPASSNRRGCGPPKEVERTERVGGINHSTLNGMEVTQTEITATIRSERPAIVFELQ